jgi:hypothetical protein
MDNSSIGDICRMYNGFAGEGVLVRLSSNAISSLEHFYANELRAIYAIIEAYLDMRDKRLFNEWRMVPIVRADMNVTVLCQLYRNRIFEVWTIVENE